MRSRDDPRAAPEDQCKAMIEEENHVAPDTTLEVALPMFMDGKYRFLPVVTRDPKTREPVLLGALFFVDALRAYSRALAETAAEEHS